MGEDEGKDTDLTVTSSGRRHGALFANSSPDTSTTSISTLTAQPVSASQSLMSSLKSRLAGGKQQSTVMRARTELGSLHVAGLLESHLGLDYLLLAASETLKERPWGIKNDSKPRGIEMTAEAAASPSRNDLVGGIDSRESFSGTSKHSRMNDISLALSAIGPLTHHIFLQAMSESIVAEK